MDPIDPTENDEMQVCTNCGSWISQNRERCPWCNSETAPSFEGETLELPTPPTAPDERGGIEWEEAAPALEPTRVVPAAEVGQPAERRDRRFWMRAYGLAFLLLLLLGMGFTGAGIYQGLNDRQVQRKVDAIEAFEQGQLLMNSGQYDLAIANFREALRLEPGFEAAQQFMEIAQRDADVAAGRLDPAVPTPVPDSEKLFAEAVEALQQGDWEIAATTFGALNSQSPDFRTEEVVDGLFEAHTRAGESALAVEDLDRALLHLDQALAARPDDATARERRKLVSTYRNGKRAFDQKQWQMAANQLRTVYIIDPSFLETPTLLATAHLRLAEAFEARTIWCEAAQQYRASLAIVRDNRVASLAAESDRRCAIRVTAPPPMPTVVPEVDTTPVLTLTPPTPTPPTPTALPTMITSPFPPTITLVPVFPTATSSAPGFAYQLAGGVGESFDDSCGGHYIRGTVTAPDGAPLAGITLRVRDQYGNVLTAVTKNEPLGQYNFPISAQPISYDVTVIAGEQALSPTVTVVHAERFASAPQACHIVNWRQRP